MPPAKSRNVPDDAKLDAKDKEKSHSGGPLQTNGNKARRQVNPQSNGRAEPPAPAIVEKGAASTGQEPVTVRHPSCLSSIRVPRNGAKKGHTELISPYWQVQWSSIDRDVLHKYRREYRLETPKAFCNSHHHYVFHQVVGVGRYSPTMRRRKTEQRKQTKEQLALAVRKHFNSMGVVENDTIAELLFSVRHKGAGLPKFNPDDAQQGEGDR
jgi:histone deacetylase complex subunit SAP30